MSLFVFRDCQRLGKPALMVVPSGTWANVGIIFPGGPAVEDIQGLPKLAGPEAFQELFRRRHYRLGTYFYVFRGDWRIDAYRRFVEEGCPLAQLCPWRPVASLRYWVVVRNRIRV